MNMNAEEILMVVIAFLIGWFLSNMISGSKNNSIVKVFSGKHTRGRLCRNDEGCPYNDRCNNGQCTIDTGKGYKEECDVGIVNDCSRHYDCFWDGPFLSDPPRCYVRA